MCVFSSCLAPSLEKGIPEGIGVDGTTKVDGHRLRWMTRLHGENDFSPESSPDEDQPREKSVLTGWRWVEVQGCSPRSLTMGGRA